ncbi:MAG: pilus assembly protein PilC [Polyangiaceae bacterium UTPRO1]|jgi:type IV pilus assembly protein PilC|nr:type II secretion system F family protein [Myxococcales bacterium]OQY68997.1 MAG: pilus assembly protein PilC [Polyangiaceae bacterium UTPRO1]
MPVFKWVGVGPNGETMRGEMEAMTRQAVITRLRTQRINPAPEKIKEKGKGFDREINLPSFGAPVKQHDIVIFTRQFATMIDAGLPLVQCLEILSQQSDSKALCKALKEVKEEVEAGSTFAAALKKHPKIFSDLYANMVAAGEVGGILDTILNRLASYMEKIVKLKSKIKGAMIYPACIIAAAVLVTGILLVYVIPVFAELFNSFGQALPAPTQFVINLSNFTINNFWIIVGGMIAVAGGFVFTSRTEQGRYYLDKIGLRLPVFGDLIRKTAIARFARTLGTLVSSGVPILDALTITGRTAGNKIIEEAIFATRASISEGKTIAEPLIASKVFPPMVCHMIAVGETTGALDQMLQKIADFYEDEVDNAVANLTSLMEPMVILILGGLIGGLVVSMYLPIFKLGSVMS